MIVLHRHVLLVILFCLCHGTNLVAQQQIKVQWATYLGGRDRDEARDVDCDDVENAYVCGIFRSSDFPAPRGVSGPQDNTGPGYLAKFSPEGELLWMMWFQGFSPHEVAVTSGGHAVVCGSVELGANTFGGVQVGPNGSTDGGIVVVSPDGERLATATFGGTRDDVATSVDFRPNGTSLEFDQQSIYVAGITVSPDVPVTLNAPQPAYGGGGSLGQGIGDGILAKFAIQSDAGTSSLVLDIQTYYGGRFLDEVLCIRARNTLGEIYVCGRTRSDNLPGTSYITTGRSGDVFNDDAFAARLDADLRPVWHMYMGGTGNDVAYTIQPRIEYDQQVFQSAVSLKIAGVYNGGSFLTPGRTVPNPTLDPPYGGGSLLGGDAFTVETSGFNNVLRTLQVVNTSGDDLCVAYPRQQSTYGNPLLFSNGGPAPFTQENGMNAYFWVTDFRGNQDAVIEYEGNGDECILDADQQRFGFGGRALRAGSRGEYFCGTTNSTLSPGNAVPGKSFQQVNRGGFDGYLVRTGCSDRQPKLLATDSTICGSSDSSVITFSFPPATVLWPDGSTAVTYVARSSGVVRVEYTTSSGCSAYVDSITINGGMLPSGRLGPADTLELCGNGDSVLVSLSGSDADSVFWSGGRPISDSVLVVSEPGAYRATLVSADGCSIVTNDIIVRLRSVDTASRIVPSISTSDSILPGSRFSIVLRLVASGGTVDLPDAWTSRIRYDGSVLFPLFPSTVVNAIGPIVVSSVSGTRMYGGDTLTVLPFRAALGETDSVVFSMDSIVFSPCGQYPGGISLPISIAGICRENGLPRFITTRSVRLAIVSVSGAVGESPLRITAAGSDVQKAEASLWSVVGKQYRLAQDYTSAEAVTWRGLDSLPSGMYMLTIRTETDVITTSVSVLR